MDLTVLTAEATLSTDSIRELIILSLLNQAPTITIANGYKTNIGANVNRVVDSLDPEELPACVIWPMPETNDRKYGNDNLEMQVRVEGLVSHGTTNPSVVSERILGDLRKCFTLPSIKTSAYGSLIEDISYQAGGTDSYAKAGDLTTGCNIILTIKYSTLTGNPYSQ